MGITGQERRGQNLEQTPTLGFKWRGKRGSHTLWDASPMEMQALRPHRLTLGSTAALIKGTQWHTIDVIQKSKKASSLEDIDASSVIIPFSNGFYFEKILVNYRFPMDITIRGQQKNLKLQREHSLTSNHSAGKRLKDLQGNSTGQRK